MSIIYDYSSVITELKIVQNFFCFDVDSPYGRPIPMRSKYSQEHKITASYYAHRPVFDFPVLEPESVKHYMNEEEKRACSIFFTEGKAIRTLTREAIDFTAEEVDGKSGSMLYVIDLAKNIYLYSNHDRHYSHSSAVSGGSVLGAGEVSGSRDGTITSMNNKSGHYRPSEDLLLKSVEIFREKGAIFHSHFKPELCHK